MSESTEGSEVAFIKDLKEPVSQEGIYDLSTKEAEDDIIINLSDTVSLVPRDNDGTATIRLEKGDRLRTLKYNDVFVEVVRGLSKLNKVPQKTADKLTSQRNVRLGIELDDYAKEAHSMKGKEPATNALSSGNALQDAIRSQSED